MCGRYTLITTSSVFQRFDIDSADKGIDLKTSYNVSPGSYMPTVTGGAKNELNLMKWGLIPSWAKDPAIGYKMINARADTVTVKPAYKKCFQKQRCLVPASGFFEWKKFGETKKPFYIKLKNEDLFSFAGLYDVWKDAEEKEIVSFTIITTEANSVVENIHDRMPVILTREEEGMWLNKLTDEKTLLKLLDPFESKGMETYEVSTLVNNARNDNADLIEEVEK